ncbi:MAG: hypothetical protein RLZZ352_47 [Pseudomonadota bacterium]|jgi:predicted ATPase
MLTRLKINGFKNLKDVDLRFGLFTCIAGANGVGKSNLFDAIEFLSKLASKQIVEAASSVRGVNGLASDARNLFSFDSNHKPLPMEFVVEAIVPKEVTDDFDQVATTTATYLEYSLTLCLAEDPQAKESIYIHHEQLRKKSRREANHELGFTSSDAFIKKFVLDSKSKRTTPFIATLEEEDKRIIKRYGEGEGSGQPQKIPASRTPQTVLAGINSKSHPTALAMRREMQSWQLLQLEPSALRAPDAYTDDAKVTAQGRHLPSALHRIGLYADVAATLSQLIPGIQSVEVDHNEIRKLRTLQVRLSGETYPASALSDGTLRFLALAIMACDPDAQGLICMEEPENGIHPLRIPQIVHLVRQLSDAPNQDDDSWTEAGELRQVIINTHSPLVVAEVPAEDLLVAESYRLGKTQGVQFKPIQGHWRDRSGENAKVFFTKGQAQAYLNGQLSTPSPKSVAAWLSPNGKLQQLDLV